MRLLAQRECVWAVGTRWIEAHTEIVGGERWCMRRRWRTRRIRRAPAGGGTDPISITVDVKGWGYYVKAPRDIGVRAYVSVWADAYTDVYLASALAWALSRQRGRTTPTGARAAWPILQPVNPAITQTRHTLIHWAFSTGTLEWSHSRPTSSRRLNDQAPGMSVACFDEVLTVDGQGNGGEVSTGGAPTRGLVWTWYVLPPGRTMWCRWCAIAWAGGGITLHRRAHGVGSNTGIRPIRRRTR